MGLGDILSDSISYPFSDISKFFIVGLIALVVDLGKVLGNISPDTLILNSVASIIGFIFAILLSGYLVTVIKSGIDHSNEIPGFDFSKNLVDGIKVLLISLVYLIIPLFITLILLFITGAIGAGLDRMAASLGVGAFISIILFIVFGIFAIVAQARFAKNGNFEDAFSIGEVIDDAKRIGFLNIILFLIVAIVIVIVASFIVGLLAIIPFIGIIIADIIIGAFCALFINRGIGLLYSSI